MSLRVHQSTGEKAEKNRPIDLGKKQQQWQGQNVKGNRLKEKILLMCLLHWLKTCLTTKTTTTATN